MAPNGRKTRNIVYQPLIWNTHCMYEWKVWKSTMVVSTSETCSFFIMTLQGIFECDGKQIAVKEGID